MMRSSTPRRGPVSARGIALGITVAATAAALSACGSDASADASVDDPVSIGVTVSNATEHYVIPWLVGRDQGFFEDHGVIVDDIVPSKGGSTTLRNMLSGDIPIADTGLTSVIESTQAGAPVTVIGGATQSAFGLDFYTMADGPVQDISDIHTWAFTNPGSVTEAVTYALPQAAGVTGDVERVASGGVGEGIALLESGDVDAAVIPPSVAAQNPDQYRQVVATADYLQPFQQTVITTTPEYAESHPAVLRAVTAGYGEAVAWIAAHPADAASLYADYSDVDPAVAADIVEKAVSYDDWGIGFNPEAITSAIDAERAAGFDGEFDVCSIFDPSYLPDGADTALPGTC